MESTRTKSKVTEKWEGGNAQWNIFQGHWKLDSLVIDVNLGAFWHYGLPQPQAPHPENLNLPHFTATKWLKTCVLFVEDTVTFAWLRREDVVVETWMKEMDMRNPGPAVGADHCTSVESCERTSQRMRKPASKKIENRKASSKKIVEKETKKIQKDKANKVTKGGAK